MTSTQIFNILAVLWREQSDAIKARDLLHREEDDGTPDWVRFNRVQRINAQQKVDNAVELVTAFKLAHPLPLDHM